MSYVMPRSIVAATAIAVGLSLGRPAQAGTVQVRDDADLLTPVQEAALRASGARYAFDARVLTTTRFSSRADFDRHVAAQLAGANMVVVGIDPAHRWTSVHFGTATRVARERFAVVENAGDRYFRGARWDEGFEAILSAAQQAVGSAGEIGQSEPRASFPWRYVLFGLLAVGGIVLVARAFQRSASSRATGAWPQPVTGASQGGFGPSPQGPWGGPSPQGPAYGPSPASSGGWGSALGTGLAGAALGGLAGYALGNALANRDEAPASGGSLADSDSNWDAGGSTSGWDDGGGDVGGDMGGDAGGGGDW